MSISSAIKKMVDAGFTPEQALLAADIFEAETTADLTTRQLRNRRYYEAQRLKKRLNPSEIKTSEIKTISDANVLKPSEIKTSLAHVDDNLLPLEITGTLNIQDSEPLLKGSGETSNSKPAKLNGKQLLFFGEQWNSLAGDLKFPQIDEIKPASMRERHALARLREMDDCEGGVAALLGKVRNSPYLRGEINGFRCTFDWIVNSSNFQKIMEGNYENREKRRK